MMQLLTHLEADRSPIPSSTYGACAAEQAFSTPRTTSRLKSWSFSIWWAAISQYDDTAAAGKHRAGKHSRMLVVNLAWLPVTLSSETNSL
jgi:hypothetical protein